MGTELCESVRAGGEGVLHHVILGGRESRQIFRDDRNLANLGQRLGRLAQVGAGVIWRQFESLALSHFSAKVDGQGGKQT
jgi:hypothetical protein